ncbi:hypothetical protein BK147_08480 [Paenibacillus sp. FSL R7-0337]|nr:hypothetical protein BK147_08480 [Paenibacillus sp. FSL R7-0337]
MSGMAGTAGFALFNIFQINPARGRDKTYYTIIPIIIILCLLRDDFSFIGHPILFDFNLQQKQALTLILCSTCSNIHKGAIKRACLYM